MRTYKVVQRTVCKIIETSVKTADANEKKKETC